MEPLTPAQRLRGFCLSILVLGVVLTAFRGGINLPFNVPVLAPPVTAVTYVCNEKTAVPPPVQAALNELNAQGIMATKFADDTTDGDDQVPEQYKIALEIANEEGKPLLVVQSGDRVLRTVKKPTTKAQVLEASQ